MQNYLPSKQFQARIILIVIFIVLFFGGRFLFNFTKEKLAQRKLNKIQNKVMVKDLIQKDTNKNGIADWEETLWGLDPNKNGEENKTFILKKREELANNTENSIIDSNELMINNNETAESKKLTQELFATVAALQQEGQLNETSIQSISEIIGQTIVPVPLEDVYTEQSLKTIEDTEENTTAYYLGFKDLVIRYENKDLGNELSFIAQGLTNNDTQVIAVSLDIARSYKSFAKELLDIPTPKSVAPNAIKLANSYAKTGQSIDSFSQLLADPVIGMQGLINYKKEIDLLVENLNNL